MDVKIEIKKIILLLKIYPKKILKKVYGIIFSF